MMELLRMDDRYSKTIHPPSRPFRNSPRSFDRSVEVSPLSALKSGIVLAVEAVTKMNIMNAANTAPINHLLLIAIFLVFGSEVW